MKRLEREKKVDHIRLLMTFKDDYPFSPPFVRILYPRFKRSTGYIIDGAFCMELLTNQARGASPPVCRRPFPPLGSTVPSIPCWSFCRLGGGDIRCTSNNTGESCAMMSCFFASLKSRYYGVDGR